MTQPGRRGDIPIDVPLAKHADVVPAVEDRSSTCSSSAGRWRWPSLADSCSPWSLPLRSRAASRASHAVAHPGARLGATGRLGRPLRRWHVASTAARFAGRRPLPRKTNFVIFALLFAAVVLRTVAQPAAANDFARSGLLAGQILWAAGATTLATLSSTRCFAANARTLSLFDRRRRYGGWRGPWRALSPACAPPATMHTSPPPSMTPHDVDG